MDDSAQKNNQQSSSVPVDTSLGDGMSAPPFPIGAAPDASQTPAQPVQNTINIQTSAAPVSPAVPQPTAVDPTGGNQPIITETPPPPGDGQSVTTFKPVRGKFGPKGIIATVFGVLVLVAATIVGVTQVGQVQIFRERAAEDTACLSYTTEGLCPTGPNSLCTWTGTQCLPVSDLQSDPNNCGRVGNVCPSTSRGCVNGECITLPACSQCVGSPASCIKVASGTTCDTSIDECPTGSCGRASSETDGGGDFCVPDHILRQECDDTGALCDIYQGEIGRAKTGSNDSCAGYSGQGADYCLHLEQICTPNYKPCTGPNNPACSTTTTPGPTERPTEGCGKCDCGVVGPDGQPDNRNCYQTSDLQCFFNEGACSGSSKTNQKARCAGIYVQVNGDFVVAKAGKPSRKKNGDLLIQRGWHNITIEEFQGLGEGDTIRLLAMAGKRAGSAGDIDYEEFKKARFRINGGTLIETTNYTDKITTNPNNLGILIGRTFYKNYVIPAGVTTFSVKAEIQFKGKWYCGTREVEGQPGNLCVIQ